MATYHLRYSGSFKQPGNVRSIDVELLEGVSVGELLSHLLDHTAVLGRREDYGSRPASEAFRILVNGRNIRLLDGEETMLSDGDTIAILIPIAGGCSRQ